MKTKRTVNQGNFCQATSEKSCMTLIPFFGMNRHQWLVYGLLFASILGISAHASTTYNPNAPAAFDLNNLEWKASDNGEKWIGDANGDENSYAMAVPAYIAIPPRNFVDICLYPIEEVDFNFGASNFFNPEANLQLLNKCVNTAPDVNVWRIDSYPDNAPLISFSYQQNGNLTLDFNVFDDTNNLVLDVNYSPSPIQGTGTVIVNDLNLSALSSNGAYHCADTNFLDVTQCSVDWNISGISDGNYFILASISDGSLTDFNASDNNFMVDNTAPILSISSPTNGFSTTATQITMEYSASDSASGIAAYYISTDGINFARKGISTQHIFSNLSIGSHTFWVRARDNAGNTAETEVKLTIIAEEIPENTAQPNESRGGYLDGTP